jgi:hypothetical protein
LLRDLASAAGDPTKVSKALTIAGAPQYADDPAAVDDLLKIAGCVDFQRLDSLKRCGVIELDPPQQTEEQEVQ